MHRIVLALTLLLSAPSYGFDWATSDNFHQMSRICHSGQSAIKNCSAEVTKRAEAEINKLSSEIHDALLKTSPADAAKFEKSQSAWVFYKDSHCALEKEYNSEDVYPYCLETLNIDRVDSLRRLRGQFP